VSDISSEFKRVRPPWGTPAWLPVSIVSFILGGIGLFLALAPSAPVPPGVPVSQRNRQFHPDHLTIKAGEVITIINDDGDLRHHAYVSSPTFAFDSGDQHPGTHTNVVFPVRGTFNVLCGIHPKMHLVVTVQ
jgi:plastocyanin